MSEDEFILALAVGMGAAEAVARQGGYSDAARYIAEYRADWERKVRPAEPRAMVRGDILPPDAARFAVGADFGVDA